MLPKSIGKTNNLSKRVELCLLVCVLPSAGFDCWFPLHCSTCEEPHNNTLYQSRQRSAVSSFIFRFRKKPVDNAKTCDLNVAFHIFQCPSPCHIRLLVPTAEARTPPQKVIKNSGKLR